MKKRDFNEWLSTFRESISTYDYYIDFTNVYKNAEKYKKELYLLNSLINSRNIKKEFKELVEKYPNVIKALPTLLAVREHEIYCQEGHDVLSGKKYNFKSMTMSVRDYCFFMEKTGLFDLLSKHLISNLYDYVLGINTGLDSNGRKNRGGHLMENLVEAYLKKGKYKYFKEMTSIQIEELFGLDLSPITNNGKAKKRFDFVVKGNKKVYGIECNFYTSSGSKLNETARSYELLGFNSKKIKNFQFVWLTDGFGWQSASNNLRETFEKVDNVYNIKEIESGIFNKIFL